MKHQSQPSDGCNDLFDQCSATGPTIPDALERGIVPTERQRQRHLQDGDNNGLQRRGREEKDSVDYPSSRRWTWMDGRIIPETIEENCHGPVDEPTRVSLSFGLYQSLRTWLSRGDTLQLFGVQSFDRVLPGKETSTLERKGSTLEPSMPPEDLTFRTGKRESVDSEHAFSHNDDQPLSPDSHVQVTMPQGDLSYPLSEDRESSRASGSHAALEGDSNDTMRATSLSIVSSISSWKDTDSSDEHNSLRVDASCAGNSDSSSIDGCPLPSAEDEDDSSSQEFNSDDDGDYSASSYASSCTETTLTPSTISAEGARSLEVRWCQVDHAVIHPLMATLFSTLAVPNMESVTVRPLQCLVLNEFDGRIAVRLQCTLALHQKSYLMDCVLPPQLVVLGQGINWCSDDDFEDWWDASERFSYSYHHHDYIYSY